MKNLIFVCVSMLVLFSCQEQPKKIPATTAVVSDSAAIVDVIHGFYHWYDLNVQDTTKQIDFTKTVGKHYALDMPMLDKYLANIKSSGLVSSELLDTDRAYYKMCEKIWQKEEAEGPPTGMDADKYFCAQDWDINFWTKSPVRIKSIGNDRAAATLYGTMGGSPQEQNFELKKENGKWLLSKIECDMGVNASTASTPEQEMVNQLAAFYSGSLPCADCDGIQTLLTLNADEKRTYTLEEEYKGKKNKTVDSKGTWSVNGDIVTLKGESGITKYQVTAAGLISLNADGSKRDAKAAKKYLLKKTMGE